jgi:hypothetical protein
MPTLPRVSRGIAINARDAKSTFALTGKLRSFAPWRAQGWQAENG